MILSPIPIAVSNIDMRTESQQILEKIDERFLAAVHALLKTYARESEAILGYTTDGEAVTAHQFAREADAAVVAAKAGRSISVEELEKRSEAWLSRLP